MQIRSLCPSLIMTSVFCSSNLHPGSHAATAGRSAALVPGTMYRTRSNKVHFGASSFVRGINHNHVNHHKTWATAAQPAEEVKPVDPEEGTVSITPATHPQ